jgi:TPR repeat protein
VLTCFLVWLGSAFDLPAQSVEDQGKNFAATKALAEKGDAEAQLRLATFYLEGTDVPRDLAKSAKWLRKSAEQGLPRAEYLLGLNYANAHGVRTNQTEAVRWMGKAAKQGLVEAQIELGRWYAEGENVRENPVEAANWYRRAADQSSAAAEYQLGQCYLQGLGVVEDIEDGVEWTRKAAHKGYALAQNSLGLCYLNGQGVTKDYMEAYKWFDLAAAQGDPQVYDFKVNQAKAASFLTPDQIAHAQKLAREFKPDQTHPSTASSQSSSTNQSLASTATALNGQGSNVGWLNVNAADQSAEIFLDGSFVGNAPAKLRLEPGSHLVEVKKAGFKDYRRQITINAGSELSLNAALQAN